MLSTLSTSGAATLNSVGVTNDAAVGGTLGVTGNTMLSTLSTSGGTAHHALGATDMPVPDVAAGLAALPASYEWRRRIGYSASGLRRRHYDSSMSRLEPSRDLTASRNISGGHRADVAAFAASASTATTDIVTTSLAAGRMADVDRVLQVEGVAPRRDRRRGDRVVTSAT